MLPCDWAEGGVRMVSPPPQVLPGCPSPCLGAILLGYHVPPAVDTGVLFWPHESRCARPR